MDTSLFYSNRLEKNIIVLRFAEFDYGKIMSKKSVLFHFLKIPVQDFVLCCGIL